MRRTRTARCAGALFLLVLAASPLRAQAGPPPGDWAFGSGTGFPTLTLGGDGTFRWGTASGRLAEFRPHFAQGAVRYYSGLSFGGTEVVLGVREDRVELYRPSGERVAEGRRPAAAADNPLGITWAGASPSPTAPQAPSSSTTGSAPLDVNWAGGSSQTTPPTPPPAQGGSNPLGVTWTGGNAQTAPSAPTTPANPAPPPAQAGGNPLGVTWAGGNSQATPSTPPPPSNPTAPPTQGGSNPLGVTWVGGSPSSPPAPPPTTVTPPPPPVTDPPKPPLPQPGACRDPWITEIVTRVAGRKPDGEGDGGECDYRRYNGGRWNDKAELERHVRTAFGQTVPPPLPPRGPSGVCRDPWITELITRIVGRKPDGEGDSGECDYRRYNGGRWNGKVELEAHIRAVFGKPAEPVQGVYVVDGTASVAEHKNLMWHFYTRFQAPEPVKAWSDGPQDFARATDAPGIYSRMFDRICSDVRPVAQGGKGVNRVFLAGFSRGAIIAVRLANETRKQCGANVVFLGLVDAVNTSMPGWPDRVDPGVPVAIHIEKPSNHGATVLTTKEIHGVTLIRNPRVGGLFGVGAITHNRMTCPMDDSADGARWNEVRLIEHAERSGARFGPRLPNSCNAEWYH